MKVMLIFAAWSSNDDEREDIYRVDIIYFFNWSKLFVQSVSHILPGGKKLLLIHDPNRAHISIDVLKYFKVCSIILYAIPAHTSSCTRPCDLVLFSVFKSEMSALVTNSTNPDISTVFTQYDVSAMIRDAYITLHTPKNFEASFR